MNSAIIATLLLASSFASQIVPIPSKPDGLSSIGGNSSQISLEFEAFYDLMCPDSRDSYKLLKATFNQSGYLTNPNFKFTIHFFPLVFHREAYTMAEGVHFIQAQYGNEAAFEFIDLIFLHQDFFGTNETYNRTRTEVENQVADLVEKNLSFNITKQEYLDGVHNSDIDEASRISWKYGCSKGVSGTPIYFANGVLADGLESYNSTDFSNFFDQYLTNTTNATNFVEKKFLREIEI